MTEMTDQLNEIANNIVSFISTSMGNIIFSLIIIFIGIKLIKYVENRIGEALGGKKLDKKLLSPITTISGYFLYLLLALLVASILGIPSSVIVMVLLIIGALVLFALQGNFKNIGSGVLILIIRPYLKGQLVNLNKVEGRVKDTNFYNTILLTSDNETVYVPNELVLDGNIVNYEKKKNRRVNIPVRISYDSDIKKAKEVLLKVSHMNESILSEPIPPSVKVDSLEEHFILLKLRVWVKKADYSPVETDLQEKIVAELQKEGIQFPYKYYLDSKIPHESSS